MRVCPRCRSIFTGEGEFCSLDGQRLHVQAADPLIGERIDRYEFVERLGTGAMGVVYRVRHTELDHDFAIKVLYGELGANKSLVERFRREAKAMSRMNHPNVVTVVDFGATEHGLNFLVMERIIGHTLESIIETRGTLAPRHAAWLTRQIAAGLGEAHRLGFVHRDVKPANVMVSGVEGREQVKVLDFGIVHLTDDEPSARLTGTGRIVGTPRYMSPEQARAAEVGPPADLYSLGVILYELLSGGVPFPGDVLADVLVMHSTVEPAPLPHHFGLGPVVSAMLQKRWEDRVQTAAEVIAMLDGCFDGLSNTVVSSIEDEIPTERPAPSSRFPQPTLVIDRDTGTDQLEVPPLADEEPLVPFPRSGSSLTPLLEPPSPDTSIYDSAPAAFDDDAFMVARETSGFDRPGSSASESLAAVPVLGASDGPTLGGTSDHFVVQAEESADAGRRVLPFVVATGILSMLALGVVVALPRFERPTVSVEHTPPAPFEPPLIIPYQLRVAEDHIPAAAGVLKKRERRIRRRRPVAPAARVEAPRLSVSELEVSLGHVLASRGLALADLSVLKPTKSLARAWRTARTDQTEAAAAQTLGDLIEAARSASLTRRLLVFKARRARRGLEDARPALPPDQFGARDIALRALEFETRNVAPGDFSRVAHALTEFEAEVIAKLNE